MSFWSYVDDFLENVDPLGFKISVEGLDPGDTYVYWFRKFKIIEKSNVFLPKDPSCRPSYVKLISEREGLSYEHVIKLNTLLTVVEGPTYDWRVKINPAVRRWREEQRGSCIVCGRSCSCR